MLPLLSPAHLDRDFDYLVPPEFDEIAQPGVRVRVRFAGRLVDGYLLARLAHSEHSGKLVRLERVVSAERVLTPEILHLATALAARYAGTRADVLRLAIPPRHARTENGDAKKTAADPSPDESSTDEVTEWAALSVADPEPLQQNTSGSAADSGPNTAGRIAENGSLSDDSADHADATAGAFESEGVTAPDVAESVRRDALGEKDSRIPPAVAPEIDNEHHASTEPVPTSTEPPSGGLTPTEAATGRAAVVRAAANDAGEHAAAGDVAAVRPTASDAAGHAAVGGASVVRAVADDAGERGAAGGAAAVRRAASDAAEHAAGGASVVRAAVNDAGKYAAAEGAAALRPAANDAAERDAADGASVVRAAAKGAAEHDAAEAGAAHDIAAVGMAATTDDSVLNSLPERVSEVAEPSYDTALSFDTAPWERYVHGGAFLAALGRGKGVRAAWQAMPGEDWARRLAELAATVVAAGRSAILMVPDQRDLDRVLAECVRLVGDSAVGLTAGLGPAARYRRWLAVLRGSARVVVGTRSAVFAPAVNLGLIAIWDDGDDTYAEPRAPYPHTREVSMLRVHETGAAFVAAGFARTAEIQAVVDTGWAHDLVADRSVLRKAAPRISAPGDSDIALERDPVARAVRIPGVAFAAARAALAEGVAVLVQVPRRGYVPALACAKCRTPARCRHCNGPLALPESRPGGRADQAEAHSPSCRWCGITETAFRCPACGSRALRAVVIGAVRTAEELGRAFPGVPIRGSGGGAVLDTVEPGPQVIVSTVGAEPVVRGGYGVALLLDGWALLSRADLRAAEDALRRWMSAAALVRPHGQVVVMAEPSLPTVQALVRWDPLGHARAEVDARAEVGFPPAVRLAAVDGATEAIDELLAAADLPADVEVLGPVPLPATARKPFSGDSPAEVERMLLRVPRRSGAALSRALTAAQAIRSTHRSDAPLRVQIDPIDIG